MEIEISQIDHIKKVTKWGRRHKKGLREELERMIQKKCSPPSAPRGAPRPDTFFLHVKPEGDSQVISFQNTDGTDGDEEEKELEGLVITEFKTRVSGLLFLESERLFAKIEDDYLPLQADESVVDFVRQRQKINPFEPGANFSDWLKNFDWEEQLLSPRSGISKTLSHPTFIEARRVCESLSDGRDGRYWASIEGVIALLHSAPKSTHQIRFEPSARLLKWWGTQDAPVEELRKELERLDLDDIILFRVVLSAVLHNEKARFSASLDDIITLIGRDTDARRSAKERETWRKKVWRSIVLFDSLAVIGTRGGRWREPGAKGETRTRMDAEQLYTHDPLLLISGTRDTEQGTFDGSAPPKTVSLVPGDWLMPFHGNREVLSEFGDVLPIAQIPRGKPSGAWAACAGLVLCQLWRELATKASIVRNSRGTDDKTEVLKFRPFTRRELLTGTIRSDYDVNAILNDPKSGHRARDYWRAAVKELKKRGVIGHYAELPIKPGSSWREEWLNQPLDIRPTGEMMADALQIHKAAQEAKKRGTRKRALSAAKQAQSDE